MVPISIQLYTVRDLTKGGNHAKILKQIGEIGYKGVEGGTFDMKPAEYRKLVADCGMVISSGHGPFPTKDNIQQLVDYFKDLGTSYFMGGFWIPDFKDLDAVKRTAEKAAFATEALAKVGITYMLHNHWMEFQPMNGRLVYEHLLDLCPNAKFEIDVYWASAFGANDPAEQVRKYRDRTPFLHLKDGPMSDKDAPMTACGKGKQNFPAIMKAANPKVLKWAVVELDRCATDMMQAVKDSYDYLVGNDLVQGNVKPR